MEISVFRLFLIFLKIGAFTFGGGYAMIPIIERELVHRFKLIRPEDFYDTLVVCQSLPGAIAINFTVFIGLRLKGYRGAFAGLLGTILPSFVFILLIAIFFFRFIDQPYVEAFFKGIRLSVVALMFLAGWKLLKRNRNWFALFMIVFTFALITGFQLHPVLIVIITGFLGYAITTVKAVVDHDIT